MKPDLSNMSLLELENLKDEAQAIMEIKKEKLIDEVYEQIMQLAATTGLTLDELVARNQQKAPTKIRKPVPVRYRNPNNSNDTWTGRGKKPRWLVALLANGAALEDFLIDPS